MWREKSQSGSENNRLHGAIWGGSYFGARIKKAEGGGPSALGWRPFWDARGILGLGWLCPGLGADVRSSSLDGVGGIVFELFEVLDEESCQLGGCVIKCFFVFPGVFGN